MYVFIIMADNTIVLTYTHTNMCTKIQFIYFYLRRYDKQGHTIKAIIINNNKTNDNNRQYCNDNIIASHESLH